MKKIPVSLGEQLTDRIDQAIEDSEVATRNELIKEALKHYLHTREMLVKGYDIIVYRDGDGELPDVETAPLSSGFPIPTIKPKGYKKG